jgi:hypothetical protein
MTESLRIYKNNIISLLKKLTDVKYQENIWLNENNPNNIVDSFIESSNMLFDDSVVDYYLEEGHILFDRKVTKALIELSNAIDEVDESRTTMDIIDDPKMQIVRQKAAKALELIKASDGSESTVEIV